MLNKHKTILKTMREELYDINPKNWLKNFQKTTTSYLLKMGLFYHVIGLILMQVGSFFATTAISDYEIPQFPVSISLALSAGLLEESVFFGIPFYLTGNPFVLLVTGAAWSVSHLFNSTSDIMSFQSLSYGGFLFSVPHIFFSLRAWSSGKGWFAVAFHSIWNLAFLLAFCGMGLRTCSVINEGFDAMNVITAASAGMIVYLAYMGKTRKRIINRFLYLIPITIAVLAFLALYSGELHLSTFWN
jgi:hypothetical protein